jgi:hypothetical protein
MPLPHVFISAETNNDGEFAKILKKQLVDTYLFKVHLIVYDKRPATDLIAEIKKCIDTSKYFIPLLTSNSISNQWVNQEIGYAVAKGKSKIYPIVEKKIINDLRGFISLTQKLDHTIEFASKPKKMNDGSVLNVSSINQGLFMLFATDFVKFLVNKDSHIYVSEITDWTYFEGGKIYLYDNRAVFLRNGVWHWISEHKVTESLMKHGKIPIDRKTKLIERNHLKGKELHYERPVPLPPSENPFED